jgi:hypothetical protein
MDYGLLSSDMGFMIRIFLQSSVSSACLPAAFINVLGTLWSMGA